MKKKRSGANGTISDKYPFYHSASGKVSFFFSLALRTLIVIITFDSYHNISSTRFRTWRNIYPSFVFFI